MIKSPKNSIALQKTAYLALYVQPPAKPAVVRSKAILLLVDLSHQSSWSSISNLQTFTPIFRSFYPRQPCTINGPKTSTGLQKTAH